MRIVELILDEESELGIEAISVVESPAIYRRNGDDEYYIYFSKDTVLKASQMYLMNSKQNNATLEHQYEIEGLSLVESWIVEDKVHDKSVKYGMDLPLGTWVGSVKVNNDKIWNEFVRTNKVKGFSIEGYFADKMERPKEAIDEKLSKEDLQVQEIIDIIKNYDNEK